VAVAQVSKAAITLICLNLAPAFALGCCQRRSKVHDRRRVIPAMSIADNVARAV
jgi:hypothetical protein